MVCAADELLRLCVNVKGGVGTGGLEAVPFATPVFFVDAADVGLVAHLFGGLAFEFLVFYGHLEKDRLAQIFHFFVPHVTQFVCSKSLRSRSNRDLNNPRYELELLLIILHHQIILVLLTTLSRVHDRCQYVLPCY